MSEVTALAERPEDGNQQIVPAASAKDVGDAGREYAAALMDVVKNQQKKKHLLNLPLLKKFLHQLP